MPSEYDILKVQDIHSLLVLPLFANTQLSGFIGLDNPELVNPGVSISLLSNAGGHLASTLNNLRMFRMLEEKQKTLESNLEELQKEKHILEALCVDYTSFYLCDLVNDTLETIKPSILSNGTEVDGMTELKFSYTSRIRYYYENHVIRESAPDFLRRFFYFQSALPWSVLCTYDSLRLNVTSCPDVRNVLPVFFKAEDNGYHLTIQIP